MRRLLLPAFAAALSSAAAAQPASSPAPAPAAAAQETVRPMDAAERGAVIEALAGKLEARFVFPDVAQRYAAMLRANLAAGAYDGLNDPKAFAEKVTADLQAVSPDRHLRLAPAEAFTRTMRMVGGPGTQGHAPEALEQTKMIGDVAYLRFNLLPDDPEVAARARRFLLDHADARAVIIDSRANRGGGLAIMNAILPLLYPQKATLVRMDTRAAVAEGMPPEEGLVRQPSPATIVRSDHVVAPERNETRLQHVPVYYLVSKRTASAAEHLALAFKHTHRAVLIGESTAGAGHYGGVEKIGERFAAFIPVGRTYDPDTGEGWEGVGVTPDVAVPADQALDEALKRAAAAGAHPVQSPQSAA